MRPPRSGNTSIKSGVIRIGRTPRFFTMLLKKINSTPEKNRISSPPPMRNGGSARRTCPADFHGTSRHVPGKIRGQHHQHRSQILRRAEPVQRDGAGHRFPVAFNAPPGQLRFDHARHVGENPDAACRQFRRQHAGQRLHAPLGYGIRPVPGHGHPGPRTMRRLR